MLDNGYIEGDDTNFGAMVVFRCLETMSHIGAPYAKCEDSGKWSHIPPKCMAGCVVPHVANGRLENHEAGDHVGHGIELAVLCDPKYETRSEPQIDCNNGTWSYTPQCTPCKITVIDIYFCF